MLKIIDKWFVEISIDNKVVFKCEYLTDVVCDFMKALYDYCSYREYGGIDSRASASVLVNGEAGMANFVFSDMTTVKGKGHKVFMFKKGENGWEISTFNADPFDLAKELVEDIESDFDNLVSMNLYYEIDEEENEIVRDKWTYWLNRLKGAIY